MSAAPKRPDCLDEWLKYPVLLLKKAECHELAVYIRALEVQVAQLENVIDTHDTAMAELTHSYGEQLRQMRGEIMDLKTERAKEATDKITNR